MHSKQDKAKKYAKALRKSTTEENNHEKRLITKRIYQLLENIRALFHEKSLDNPRFLDNQLLSIQEATALISQTVNPEFTSALDDMFHFFIVNYRGFHHETNGGIFITRPTYIIELIDLLNTAEQFKIPLEDYTNAVSILLNYMTHLTSLNNEKPQAKKMLLDTSETLKQIYNILKRIDRATSSDTLTKRNAQKNAYSAVFNTISTLYSNNLLQLSDVYQFMKHADHILLDGGNYLWCINLLPTTKEPNFFFITKCVNKLQLIEKNTTAGSLLCEKSYQTIFVKLIQLCRQDEKKGLQPFFGKEKIHKIISMFEAAQKNNVHEASIPAFLNIIRIHQHLIRDRAKDILDSYRNINEFKELSLDKSTLERLACDDEKNPRHRTHIQHRFILNNVIGLDLANLSANDFTERCIKVSQLSLFSAGKLLQKEAKELKHSMPTIDTANSSSLPKSYP
ncbi:MAG: hypothetical protein Q8R83_02505 [Legionellaceae bacterium]|nr:hypothetical protein [Legionellaceae bacterium]